MIDVTNSVYYFNWLETPNIIWVDIANVDFDSLDTYYYLRPQDPELVADVKCDFHDENGAKLCTEDKTSSSASERFYSTALISMATLLVVIVSAMYENSPKSN